MSEPTVDFKAALHEMFVLWPAWDTLVSHVSSQHPREACPHSVYGAAMAADHDRLAALLYGHQVGETLQDATNVLDDLLLMARDGARPRFGAEMGLTPETFGLARMDDADGLGA
jgi:hypothetical protein